MTPTRQLSDAEKLRRALSELLETERTYVRHLGFLMKTYLEPLRRERLLSTAEVAALFGNIQEIFKFQQQFLAALERAVVNNKEDVVAATAGGGGGGGGGGELAELTEPHQFKVSECVLDIGSGFLSRLSTCCFPVKVLRSLSL